MWMSAFCCHAPTPISFPFPSLTHVVSFLIGKPKMTRQSLDCGGANFRIAKLASVPQSSLRFGGQPQYTNGWFRYHGNHWMCHAEEKSVHRWETGPRTLQQPVVFHVAPSNRLVFRLNLEPKNEWSIILNLMFTVGWGNISLDLKVFFRDDWLKWAGGWRHVCPSSVPWRKGGYRCSNVIRDAPPKREAQAYFLPFSIIEY